MREEPGVMRTCEPSTTRSAARGAILGAVLTAAFISGAARATFVASPMELHLTAGPGQSEQQTITIHNQGTAVLAVKIYLSDFLRQPDGAEQELPAAGLERSCAGWIALQDQLIEINPGEARETRVMIDVPVDAEGSYWSKLYIEETSPARPQPREVEGRSYTIFMKERLGVRIIEDVAGTGRLDARVTNVSVGEAPDCVPDVRVKVENPGSRIARCTGRIELRTSGGAVEETLQLGTQLGFWVYPGETRELSARGTRALGAGTYTALAIVDFGGDHLVAGDAVFRATAQGLRMGIATPE